jgi:hypothetical protein
VSGPLWSSLAGFLCVHSSRVLMPFTGKLVAYDEVISILADDSFS